MDLAGGGLARVTGTGPMSPPRKSAPYGQACTNCSKAKCKCISRGGPSAVCERCHRLGKECVPFAGVRKRAARRPAAERTAHLEEKLDDLVSILRAQAAGNPTAAAAAAPGMLGAAAASADLTPPASVVVDPNPVSAAVSTGHHKPGSDGRGRTMPLTTMTPVVDRPMLCDGYPINSSYPTPPSVASSSDPGLSPAEAEEALRLFRDHFLQYFPFVYISQNTTADELQKTKPFLWLNIVTLCCKSQSRKGVLSQRVREIVAQRMLIDLDRNVDLLLGLLTFLGWGMHYFNGKPYIVALVNLAVTIVTDLRLDKRPQDNFFRELHCFKPTYPYPKTALPATRSNEERRAVLGCFIICSSISSFLRTQTMRWSAHMEDCLQKLAANPECQNDELLVTIVKTYKIQEDIAYVTWRSVDFPGTIKPPPMIYAKALRASLETVRNSVPPSLANSKILLGHLYATELAIADMSLWHVNPWLTTHPLKPSPADRCSSSTTTTTNGAIDFGKLEAYYASLQASKAGLDNFLSFPSLEYAYISFSPMLHLGRATQTLYRLLMVDDPDWDRNIVRGSVDLMAAVERVADKFAQVPRLFGLEPSGGGGNGGGGEAEESDSTDYYTRAANALRGTIPLWNAAVEQVENGGVAAEGEGEAGPEPPVFDPSQHHLQTPGIEFTSMEWVDDHWLTDMLRSWEGEYT